MEESIDVSTVRSTRLGLNEKLTKRKTKKKKLVAKVAKNSRSLEGTLDEQLPSNQGPISYFNYLCIIGETETEPMLRYKPNMLSLSS